MLADLEIFLLDLAALFDLGYAQHHVPCVFGGSYQQEDYHQNHPAQVAYVPLKDLYGYVYQSQKADRIGKQ